LILVDPAGARPIGLSLILKLARLPGLGELALGLFGNEGMVRNIATDFFDPALVEVFQEKYRVQLQLRGFKRAILSSMRRGMLGAFSESYARIGRLTMPVLLLWGRNDKTVPFEHSREILKLVPRAEFHVIEDCSHIPHYEKPETVNPILMDFLKKQS
jgi:pimeloyl-ACP methyl ester carboxylesterase